MTPRTPTPTPTPTPNGTATGPGDPRGTSLPGTVECDCFGVTDQGREREKNEDQFLVAELNRSVFVRQTSLSEENRTRLVGSPQARLLVVADGMGGHGGGDTASAVAVNTIVGYVLDVMPWFFRLDDRHRADIAEELSAILRRCQSAIEVEARNHRYPRMGTTLTMAYVVASRAYIVHAGDSRAYLFRAGQIRQITEDHTMAQKLVEQDVLSAEKAAESPWSHQLWNAVAGGDSDLAPDVYYVPMEAGDTLLLCTDGLTKHVDDDTIAAVLSREPTAEKKANRLVRLANEGGGSDNITAAVASFDRVRPVKAR